MTARPHDSAVARSTRECARTTRSSVRLWPSACVLAGVALLGLPAGAKAQPACTDGALSAYLWSAGIECTTGDQRMRELASNRLTPSQGWAVSPVGCGGWGIGDEICQWGAAKVAGSVIDAGWSDRVVPTTVIEADAAEDEVVSVLLRDGLLTPEPAAIVLIATGLSGIGAMVRYRRRRHSI